MPTKANYISQFLISGNDIVAGSITATDLGTIYTDNLIEGTNLYFTNARSRAAISVAGSGSYDEASGVITITGGVESVNGANGSVVLTTANVAESGNLYFTNARARAAISVAGSGSYDQANGIITVTGGVTTVNGANGTVVLTTANVAESGNLYFTDTRARAAITAGNTLVYTEATGNITMSLSGVTAGTYGGATQAAALVIDKFGRITSASNVEVTAGSSGAGSYTTYTYTGNGSTTTFAATSGISVNNIMVMENGVVQTPTTDYSVSGSNVVFTAAPASNVSIQIRALAGSAPGGSDTYVQFNDGGSAFGGDAGLTYNKTTNTLSTDVYVASAGTVSAPAITTSGDTNTGLFFPAADTIAFTEGGAEAMRIDSEGNLGIGSTSPSTYGDSGGSGGRNVVVKSTGTGRGVLVFASECTAGADELLGKINFIDSDSTNTLFRGAGILGVRGSDANSAYLRFDTANSGNPAERMRITSGGTLNIGTTASATSGGFPTPLIYGKQLNNSGSWSGLQLESNTDDSTLGIGFNGTNFILSTSYRSTGNYKNIVIAPQTTAATFNTNQTVKFETSISVGGVAPTTSGAGISFPATQSASSDANTLDDYEEGSYTPTDSSGASLSFTSAYGYYTKVGRLVTYNFAVTYPSTASGSIARISLPFTQSSGMDPNASTGGFMFYVYGATTSTIMPIIGSGNNYLNMYFQSNMFDVTNANLSGKILRGMVIFYV